MSIHPFGREESFIGNPLSCSVPQVLPRRLRKVGFRVSALNGRAAQRKAKVAEGPCTRTSLCAGACRAHRPLHARVRARGNRDRPYVTLAPARVGVRPRICSRGTRSPDTVFWRNRSVMAATRPSLPRSCPRAEWRGDAAKQRVPIRSGAPAGRGPADHRDATPHQSRTGGPRALPQLGNPIFRSRRAKRGSLRRSRKTGSTPRSGTRSSRCFTACSSISKACSLSPSPTYAVAIR